MDRASCKAGMSDVCRHYKLRSAYSLYIPQALSIFLAGLALVGRGCGPGHQPLALAGLTACARVHANVNVGGRSTDLNSNNLNRLKFEFYSTTHVPEAHFYE